MGEDFSSTPQYTYTFSAAERLAGELVYSTGYDLNGDNKADFYVMSYYGTSTAYRSAFKVIDVTTGNAIFQKDDPNFSYTYPIFEDINNDGKLECIIMKYPYPSLLTYTTEVYTTGITAVAGDSRPAEFKLSQNYPNPFNPSTKIDFSLNQPSSVSVKIYDIKGSLVKTLLNSYKNSGSYDVTWDGTNDSGKRLSTGVYFYELISDNNQIVKKMLLLK